MKYLLFTFLLLSIDMSASNTHSDDLLYVWARNGLNVRSGPSTSYPVVDKLSFGDSVEFILEKDISYNIKALTKVDTNYFSYSNEVAQPYIMYGWWRLIRTKDGTSGYVISQYLIGVKPVVPEKSRAVNETPFKLISTDTSYLREEYTDGESLNSVIDYTFVKGIKQSNEYGGVWFGSTITFPNFTIAEVIVMMQIDGDGYIIRRNWKEEILLSDPSGMCNIILRKKDENVIYSYSCSC